MVLDFKVHVDFKAQCRKMTFDRRVVRGSQNVLNHVQYQVCLGQVSVNSLPVTWRVCVWVFVCLYPALHRDSALGSILDYPFYFLNSGAKRRCMSVVVFGGGHNKGNDMEFMVHS